MASTPIVQYVKWTGPCIGGDDTWLETLPERATHVVIDRTLFEHILDGGAMAALRAECILNGKPDPCSAGAPTIVRLPSWRGLTLANMADDLCDDE